MSALYQMDAIFGKMVFMKNIVSVIISTHNEMKLDFLRKSLENLHVIPGVELIIVDRKSDDGTSELASRYADKMISTTQNSRAKRLNMGIEIASGEIIFLHHPRSIIDTNALRWLIKNKADVTWGGLTHQFDEDHFALRFTSWYSNMVRGRIREILYLDHCIFFRKNLLPEHDAVPEVDVFEDTLLSEKLKAKGRMEVLPYVSKTSAIRFTHRGVFTQALVNQLMKIGFYLNLSDKWMNRLYEGTLKLNSKYKKV
ncbi:MAG: glycosyltransferase [Deltaproteobacteria bacterium]|nr:MAG: glycosyltransferase [Deltaproteobacteria bacterium]